MMKFIYVFVFFILSVLSSNSYCADFQSWHSLIEQPHFSDSSFSESPQKDITSPKRPYCESSCDDESESYCFSVDSSPLRSPTKKLCSDFNNILISSPAKKILTKRKIDFKFKDDIFEFNEKEIREVYEKRKDTRILFVGVHTGIPELDFLEKYFHMSSHLPDSTEVELTRYDSWNHNFINDDEKDHSYCYRCNLSQKGYLVDDSVDATLLDDDDYEQRGFVPHKYTHIIWVGPTFDEVVTETDKMLKNFIKACGKILRPEGKVIIVQDMFSPIFRNIQDIEGAKVIGRIKLLGRETHFREILSEREDSIIEFEKISNNG